MKRPFFVAAVIGLAAAYLSIYSSGYIVLSAGVIIIACYFIFYKYSKTPLFYILFVLIFPIMVIRTEYYSRGMRYQGKLTQDCYAYIKGEAVSVIKGGNSYATRLNNALLIPDWENNDEKVNEPVKSGIIIYSEDSFCHAGDYIWVRVKLKDFEEPTNEGQFNARAYYTSDGINYQGIFNKTVNITPCEGTLKASLLNIADSIKNVYVNTFTQKNAGTMRAIVLGDRSVLDDEIKELYKKNGISHILAISALHITMVGMLVYRMLKKIISVIRAAVLSSVIMLFYLYITGNSVSAGRAVIMILVFMLADVLGRTSDGVNTLGLAVVILIIRNPYCISNAGFLMSFLAMAGIIFVKPIFSNEETIMLFFRKKKMVSLTEMFIYHNIIDMLITGLCVQIATLPVVLSMSGQIAIISLLLNIVVIPLMSVIMVSGILTGIMGLISMKAAIWTAGAGEYILDLYSWLCEKASGSSGAVIVTGHPPEKAVVLYYVFLIVWCVIYYMKVFSGISGKYRNVLPVILYLIITIQLRYNTGCSMKISMLDVGQGDSIVLQTSDGFNALFDGGSTSKKNIGRYRIYTYLKYAGVRSLDYVFVSHPDKDHISGIYELIDMCDNTFEIKNIVLPHINDTDETLLEIRKMADRVGINVLYACRGDALSAGNLSISCVHPCKNYNYESANDYSAVYFISFGKFSMLMTGDAESKAEKCLIQDARKSDSVVDLQKLSGINVLKAGHHGSRGASSENFLRFVKPETALISCGVDNSYGHPHKETLQRLKEAGTKVYRTDDGGEIMVRVWEDSYAIEVFGEQKE